MPLCKRKVYVIRGFHGNKVAIYSKGGKRRENRRPVEKVKMVWFGLLKGGKTIRLWEKQTTGRSGIRGNKKKMGGRRGGGGGKKKLYRQQYSNEKSLGSILPHMAHQQHLIQNH